MREQLRRGEIDDITKPENQTARYRELDKRFDELVQKQRETLVKDHLDQIYTKNGAEGLNAGTSEDWTIYFVRVPANRLELWSWLESDRLLNPVFREFYAERDVVYEERRMRTESTPLGKFDEAFNAAVLGGQPLQVAGRRLALRRPSHHQGGGRRLLRHLLRAEQPDRRAGRRLQTAGGASRCSSATSAASRAARRSRRRWSPSSRSSIAEKRFNAEAETSPTVRIWWHAVPFVHKDRTALDLVSDVLTGRTGRLYKGLVTGRQVANEASASVDLKKYEGVFQVECTVKDGKDPAAVEQAVDEEIEQAPEGAAARGRAAEGEEPGQGQRLPAPVVAVLDRHPAHDLRRLRRLAVHQHLRGGGGPRDRRRHPARGPAVLHQGEPRRWASSCARRARPPRRDPDLAALPAPAQAMARQQIARIEAETDPAKLREGLAQMEAGQGPGAGGDEAGVRAHPQAGAGAPGRPGGREEVSTDRAGFAFAVLVTLAAVTLAAATVAAPAAAQAPAIPDHPDKLSSRRSCTPRRWPRTTASS